MRIVDVRDEGAAVHMAHAHAVLTGGVGIAMVTAGPGVTNCVTAMANAQLERVPVLLIGGCAPVPQDDLGPLQGIAHVDIMRPVTRASRTLRVADNVLRDLDKAYATAAGDGNPPGPGVRRDSRPTCCARPWRRSVVLRRVPRAEAARAASARSRRGRRGPPRSSREAKRPLVLTGRGALRRAARARRASSTARGAVYLDTQESRDLVPGRASVGGRRGARARDAGGRPA